MAEFHDAHEHPATDFVGWQRAIYAVLAVATVLALLRLQSMADGPWLLALIVLCLAVPLAAFQIYLATIHRIHALGTYADRSMARWLFSGVWLRLGIGLVFAVAGALVAVVGLVGLGPADWLAPAAAVPVFVGCWLGARRLAQREWSPLFRVARALVIASWLASLILVGINWALHSAMGGVSPYPSLDAAITAGRAGAPLLGSSAIATALSQLAGMWNGLLAYLLGSASDWGTMPNLAALGVAAFLQWTFYFAICRFVASFMVPHREYTRVLAPLEHSDVSPPVDRRNVFIAALLTTVMLIGVYPVTVASLEAFLLARPWIAEALERAEANLEKIDDIYVSEGTLEEIKEVAVEIAQREDAAVPVLRAALDAGFDRMEGNVDLYLDWYYSVFGEWARIGNLLMGNTEEYLARKVDEKLTEGDPFAGLDGALEAALASDAAGQIEFRKRAETIIAQNRVEPGVGRRPDAVAELHMSEILTLPPDRAVISFQERLGAGVAAGAGGLVAGAVAGKVVAKLAAKGTLKMAAKAIMEVAGERGFSLGAAGAGAAAGAVAGSAIPVVGTAAGAVIGGVIAGVAVSVSTDYLMLKLEERISRETQKAAILAAIEEKRLELREALEGVPDVAPGLP